MMEKRFFILFGIAFFMMTLFISGCTSTVTTESSEGTVQKQGPATAPSVEQTYEAPAVSIDREKVTMGGTAVKASEKAPDFKALTTDLKEFKLSDLKGNVILISSVPSLDTKICSLQTRRFNGEIHKLGNKVKFITISADLPFAQQRFQELNSSKDTIFLSDHKDLDFGNKYGFVINDYRLLTRGVVVIDKDGVIKYIENCKNINDHPNYEQALQALNALLK